MSAPRFPIDPHDQPRPESAAPAFSPSHFAFVPLAVSPGFVAAGGWALELYRLAYEQAREALKPSAFERRTAPVWN